MVTNNGSFMVERERAGRNRKEKRRKETRYVDEARVRGNMWR